MPVLLLAQLSDLQRSGHKSTYIGDSTKLKALTEPLRGKPPMLLVERQELCSDIIQEVGTLLVEGEANQVVYVDHNFGNSCKGVRLILCFKEDQLIGFYRTSYVLTLKTKGSQLLYQHEGLGAF